MCTITRAKKITIFLSALAVVLYSHGIWTSGIAAFGRHSQCVPLPKFKNLIQIANNIDTVITLIIPSVAIFVMNIRIAYAITHFYGTNKSSTTLHFQSKSKTRPTSSTRESSLVWTARGTSDSSIHNFQNRSQIKVNYHLYYIKEN